MHIEHSRFSEHDVWLFREGTHAKLHDTMGCHLQPGGGATFTIHLPPAQLPQAPPSGPVPAGIHVATIAVESDQDVLLKPRTRADMKVRS